MIRLIGRYEQLNAAGITYKINKYEVGKPSTKELYLQYLAKQAQPI